MNRFGRWKGGRRIHNGYYMTYKPGRPTADSTGYIYEHRLVMEEHLGRYLESKEIIHHKNHNKLDNRIENLEIVSPITHNLIHAVKDMVGRQCSVCGSKETLMVKKKLIGLRPHWLKIGDKLACMKCYDRHRYVKLNGEGNW